MSIDGLFRLHGVEPPADVEPLAKRTEREMLDLLAKRYTKVDMGAHRYAYASHVPSRPLFGARIADFIAVDCWRGPWAAYKNAGVEWSDPSWGYAIHGHEVKVSRSDWLAELRQPEKSEAFRPYVDYWWLVIADPAMVKDGELPDGWGLMAPSGDRLRAVRKAPKLSVLPMPREMNIALMRSIAKTARAAVGGSCDTPRKDSNDA